MAKKKLAFLLAVTEDYMFAAGNVVLSIKKQMPAFDYDFVIFYDNILPQDRKIFEGVGNCFLRKYEIDESFRKNIINGCPKFNDVNLAKHFSFLKFAKFEMFKLLNDYENVVWLDADIAVQSNISSIVRYGPFGITADESWTVQNNFTASISGYNMSLSGVCSAVILVNEVLPYEKMYKWCYEAAEKYCEYFKNIDQGIFNLLLQEFNISPVLMPLDEWQCIAWKKQAITARIVHFGTKSKVWNNVNICNAFPEWYRVHLEWLALGGSDFDQTKICPRNVLGTLEHFDKLVKEEKQKTVEEDGCVQAYLLDFIPFWKIKKKRRTTKFKLFGFPLLKIKRK